MTRSEAARLLRVEQDADDAAIRAAFRAVARGAHPDAATGDNPELLAAAKQARDILLGVEPATPEPTLHQPHYGAPNTEAPSDGLTVSGPWTAGASWQGEASHQPRPRVIWEAPAPERRRWLPIFAFVGLFALLLVGAVLGALLLVRDTADDITSLLPTPVPEVEQADDECVIVQLSPASVFAAECSHPDAQRIMGVFGGQLDCPFDLNELFVVGQTWCLQDADLPVAPALSAPAQRTPPAQPTPPGAVSGGE